MTGYIRQVYKDLVQYKLKITWNEGQFRVGNGLIGAGGPRLTEDIRLADDLYLKYTMIKQQ